MFCKYYINDHDAIDYESCKFCIDEYLDHCYLLAREFKDKSWIKVQELLYYGLF